MSKTNKDEVTVVDIGAMMKGAFGSAVKLPEPKKVEIPAPVVQVVDAPVIPAPVQEGVLRPVKGATVRVTGGNKFVVGNEYEIFWVGQDRYRAGKLVYGLKGHGTKAFEKDINCVVVRSTICDPVECEYPTVDDDGKVHNPPMHPPAPVDPLPNGFRVGGEVVVIKGRKFPIGAKYRIFWIGNDRFHAGQKVYGIEDEKGTRGFIPGINVQLAV